MMPALLFLFAMALAIIGPAFALDIPSEPYCRIYSDLADEMIGSGYAHQGGGTLPDGSRQELWLNPLTGEFVGLGADDGEACLLFTGLEAGSGA